MGNCVETFTPRQEEEEDKEEGRGEAGANGFRKEGSIKIRVLLTKGELEWLLLQLKEKRGKRLEDVMEEIGRGRGREKEKEKGRFEAWKPSLECIMESPEVQSFDEAA